MKFFKEKSSLLLAAFPILAFQAPSSVLAEIAKSFPNASAGQVQMIISTPSIVSFVFSIITILLAPYIYKRYLVIGSTALIPIVGLVLYFCHPSVEFMIAMSALIGIPVAVNVAVIPGLIRESLPEKDCGPMLGFMGAAISVGLLVINFLVGQFSKGGWSNCFIVYMLVFVIVIYEILFLPKGRKDPKGGLRSKEKVSGNIFFCIMLYMIFILFLTVFQSNISLLVNGKGFGSSLETSYVNMSYNVLGIMAGIITGLVIPRVKEWIFLIGVLCSAAGMFIGFITGIFPPMLICGGLCGAAYSIISTSVNFYAAMYTTDANRTLCVALVNMGGMLTIFLSPIIFGLTSLAPEGLFLLASILFLLLAAVSAVYAFICRKN